MGHTFVFGSFFVPINLKTKKPKNIFKPMFSPVPC